MTQYEALLAAIQGQDNRSLADMLRPGAGDIAQSPLRSIAPLSPAYSAGPTRESHGLTYEGPPQQVEGRHGKTLLPPGYHLTPGYERGMKENGWLPLGATEWTGGGNRENGFQQYMSLIASLLTAGKPL